MNILLFGQVEIFVCQIFQQQKINFVDDEVSDTMTAWIKFLVFATCLLRSFKTKKLLKITRRNAL